MLGSSEFLYWLEIFQRYLGVEQQLLFVVVEQRGGAGCRVVDEDLQARVERRAAAVRAAREHALEALVQAAHAQHRAVGRPAAETLQRWTQPAQAEDEERQHAEHDQKETEPNAAILRLRVLIRDPDLSHRSARSVKKASIKGGAVLHELQELPSALPLTLN